jgi:hypothetical protein
VVAGELEARLKAAAQARNASRIERSMLDFSAAPMVGRLGRAASPLSHLRLEACHGFEIFPLTPCRNLGTFHGEPTEGVGEPQLRGMGVRREVNIMTKSDETANGKDPKFSFGVREMRAAKRAEALAIEESRAGEDEARKPKNDGGGFDPYNTSGSFDRKKHWERIRKR